MHRQLLINLFVGLLLGCIVPAANGQDYSYNYTSAKFTPADGLADITIWSLFQDNKGYMWAGTKAGISRFDGLSFRNYYMSDGLLDNEGYDIIQWSNDTLSILTRYGISLLVNDTITSVSLPDSTGSQYFSYQLRHNDQLYLFNIMNDNQTSAARLMHYVFDWRSKKFTPIVALAHEDIIKAFTGRDGRVNIFTKKGGWWQLLNGHIKQVAVVGRNIIDICSVSDTVYYFYDQNLKGFYQLSISGQRYDTVKQVSYAHETFAFKRNLVCTSTGTLYYNGNNDTVFRIANRTMEPAILSGYAYYDMLVDNQDGLWLGSHLGLCTYYNFHFREHHFEGSRNSFVLNAFHDKNSRLWFSGHYNGVWYINKDKVYTVQPQQVKGLNARGITTFPIQGKGAARTSDGCIFFPFYDGVISVDGNNYTAYTQQAAIINHLLPDYSEKELYAGTNYGLFKVKPDSGFKNIAFPNTCNAAVCSYLFKDKKQRIWAVTQKGTGIIVNDTVQPVTELAKLGIFSMDHDYQGRYWIGTSKGLFCYREGQQPYQVGHTIFKGEVKSVLVYNEDILVVVDNHQISFLNLTRQDTTEAWVTFNNHTGYTSQDILNRSIYKDADGDIWLLGGDRVITCNPARILDKRPLPKVFVSTFASSSNNVHWQTVYLSNQEKIHTKPGNSNIRIEFLSIYLADPLGISYQYRLKGLTDAWSAPTSNSYVSYAHLSSGGYTFEVRSSADGIHWSETTAQVSFYIPPFWWQTAWFIALLIAMGVCLSWWLIRYYISLRWKQHMRRLEKQLAIAQERHRISGEIHDDLGAGLSGIRLQAELAARKAPTPELKAALSRIYKVASELSARMREVIWSLNTENDTLEKLLYYMQQEGYKLFEHTDIKFRATYPAQLPETDVSGQKRRDIYLIVKEALHNAMKHAGATEVSLTATLQQGMLHITIQDNGMGMSHAIQGEGNGIRNMHHRAAKTGGQLQISSGQGVTVHFSINITSLAKLDS